MFLRNYSPAKTLYSRYKRWPEAGVFERISEALACENADLSTLMIDASHVKVHRISANGVKKRRPRDEPIGQTKVAWLHRANISQVRHPEHRFYQT